MHTSSWRPSPQPLRSRLRASCMKLSPRVTSALRYGHSPRQPGQAASGSGPSKVHTTAGVDSRARYNHVRLRNEKRTGQGPTLPSRVHASDPKTPPGSPLRRVHHRPKEPGWDYTTDTRLLETPVQITWTLLPRTDAQHSCQAGVAGPQSVSGGARGVGS